MISISVPQGFLKYTKLFYGILALKQIVIPFVFKSVCFKTSILNQIRFAAFKMHHRENKYNKNLPLVLFPKMTSAITPFESPHEEVMHASYKNANADINSTLSVSQQYSGNSYSIKLRPLGNKFSFFTVGLIGP